MNVNAMPLVKVEEIPTIIIDDQPTIKLTGRAGRRRKNNKNIQKPKLSPQNEILKLKRQLELALLRLAVKTKEVEELEQKLKNNNHANNPHVCILKPIFSTTRILHPLNFLENLIIYLDKLPEYQRTIDTVVDCLEGDARNWAAILKPRWNIIDDFIRDFLDQHWGMEDQSLLRKDILNGRWFGNGETMCRHFTWLVSQARWLKDRMTDDQLVYEIMHHYPKHVQVAWYVSKKNKTVLDATEFLKKMDEVEVLNLGKKRIRQRQNMRMRYVICPDQYSPAVITENANNADDSKKFKPE